MSLTVPTTQQAGLDDAFRALQRLVREWRALGRKTTTAGLKPALQQAAPGFLESDFGFSAFRDFVRAAEAAGHVRVQKLPTGHAMVLLPDEPSWELPPAGPLPAPQDAQPANPTTGEQGQPPSGRLKQEVWATFVDWHDSHDRLWDRRIRRAITFPIDDHGRPAWLDQADRFTRVDPVGQGTQTGWMREWAETVPSPARDLLLAALAPGVPRGQFRRELNASGLAAAWRSELQRRVVEHAAAWASANDVPLAELFDQRPVRAQPPSEPAAPARTLTTPQGPLVKAPQPATTGPGPTGEAALLRALLHRAIDRMSLVELLSLPVRAEHLLDR